MSQKRFDALTDEQRSGCGRRPRWPTQASVDADLRRDDAGPRALRQGCRGSSPLTPSRSTHCTAAVAAGGRPAGRRSARAAAARRTSRRSPTDTRSRRARVPASCQQAGSAPADASTIPDERSALPDGVYRVEITASDGERRAQQRRGVGRNLDARGERTGPTPSTVERSTCATELRREQRLRGGARGRRPPGDRQHRVLRLQPRAVGEAHRLPAAGIARHRPLWAEPVVLDDLGARRRVAHVRRPTSSRPPGGSSSPGSESADRRVTAGSSPSRSCRLRVHCAPGAGHRAPRGGRRARAGPSQGVRPSAAVVCDGELGPRSSPRC